MKPIVYVMGPCCAGKGTLLSLLYRRADDPKVGLVEVGKAFRAKYPSSYFKGHCNPEHTRAEALHLYDTELSEQLEKGNDLVLVDGMPRVSQVDYILTSKVGLYHPKLFLLLDAPVEVRKSRASWRFTPGTSDWELAQQRIVGDCVSYYEVLRDLLKHRVYVEVIDTNRPVESWTQEVIDYLHTHF